MNDTSIPEQPDHAPAPAHHAPEQTGPRIVDSTELFHGNKEMIIRHNGREYRLRRTHLGKLILTA